MPSLEEVIEFQRENGSTRKDERLAQKKHEVFVGETMSQLIADPRWEVWAQHIESLRADAERKHKVEADMILNGVLNHDDYVAAMIRVATFKNQVLAYKTALQVAQTLIERGEKAILELGADISVPPK